MEKKATLAKEQRLNLEEKISMLSGTEEAYVLGFIEGAIFDEQKKQQPLLSKTPPNGRSGAGEDSNE